MHTDWNKGKEISRITKRNIFAPKEMDLPQKKYICPQKNIFAPKELKFAPKELEFAPKELKGAGQLRNGHHTKMTFWCSD